MPAEEMRPVLDRPAVMADQDDGIGPEQDGQVYRLKAAVHPIVDMPRIG